MILFGMIAYVLAQFAVGIWVSRRVKTEADYISLREARDRTLPMPKLILHALQVNVRGGELPAAEDNGRRYLKIPLDALPGAVWG